MVLKLLMKSNFKTFDDMDFPVCNNLKLSKKYTIYTMPNILFIGDEGSGRTTKMRTFLCEILDETIYSLSSSIIELGKKGDQFIFTKSNYHMEIDFKLNNIKEKDFYEIFLKDYGQTMNIAFNIPKIIVIKNCENITNKFEKQLSLLMDKYYLTLRFIFISSKQFSTPGIKSRIIETSIKNIKKNDIVSYLLKHSKKNNINITEKDINEIVNIIFNNCLKYNLKSIFELYEMSTIGGKYISFYKSYTTLFDELLTDIFNKSIHFQDLSKVRDVIFDMYVNLYDISKIITYTNKKVYKHFSNNHNFMTEYSKLVAEVDKYIKISNKDIIHVEKFLVGLIILIHKHDIKIYSTI